MRWSIRYRLLLPLGLLLLGVVGFSVGSAVVSATRTERRILGQVRSVVQSLSNASYPLTQGVLEQVKQLSGAEYLLVGEDRIATLPILLKFDARSLLPSELESRLVVGEKPYLSRAVLLRVPHRNAGSMLYVFYPEDLLDDAIRDAVRPSLFGLIFGLVTVVFTFGIAQRLVGRIRELDRRTRLIARGDFSPMPLPKQQDELYDLASSVNGMAGQLSQLQEAVRRAERLRLVGQLSGGLAHQLRNSVTGARLALQVHQAGHPDESEALEVVLRQLRLMDSNLRRFIELGRDNETRREVCSLTAILEDMLSLLRPQADHIGIKLTEAFDSPDALILGDPSQLTDLFLNLLTNAIEAAGPGGAVEFRMLRESECFLVEIRDNGPGPPAEIAERLFEPFATAKPEGIGLGLAVAKRATEAHGGTLDWRREGNETVFRVRLPKYDTSKTDAGR